MADESGVGFTIYKGCEAETIKLGYNSMAVDWLVCTQYITHTHTHTTIEGQPKSWYRCCIEVLVSYFHENQEWKIG